MFEGAGVLGLVGEAPWEAVRDYLSKGGSPLAPVVAVVVLVVLAGVLSLLNRLQQRGGVRAKADDPKRLFRAVLRTLDLSVTQRDLLRRMAAELRVEHPTAMLLTPGLFAEHAGRWTKEVESRGQAVSEIKEGLKELSVALFGLDPKPPGVET